MKLQTKLLTAVSSLLISTSFANASDVDDLSGLQTDAQEASHSDLRPDPEAFGRHSAAAASPYPQDLEDEKHNSSSRKRDHSAPPRTPPTRRYSAPHAIFASPGTSEDTATRILVQSLEKTQDDWDSAFQELKEKLASKGLPSWQDIYLAATAQPASAFSSESTATTEENTPSSSAASSAASSRSGSPLSVSSSATNATLVIEKTPDVYRTVCTHLAKMCGVLETEKTQLGEENTANLKKLAAIAKEKYDTIKEIRLQIQSLEHSIRKLAFRQSTLKNEKPPHIHSGVGTGAVGYHVISHWHKKQISKIDEVGSKIQSLIAEKMWLNSQLDLLTRPKVKPSSSSSASIE